MCGICGYVGRPQPDLLDEMTELLAHRGPDGSGTRNFAANGGSPPAGLGHRRLKIIDPTEAGAQPMEYARGRYWITYNGELYNFAELREELAAAGFEFRSRCDTEVLLAMYARYGEAMLERLNGMFAFAIWDNETGELFLARDRLGVKPLYYTRDGDGLLFASELKALLLGMPRQSLNLRALADYLTFLWVPDPETLFEGIKKLPGGHCAVFADGELRIRQYWDMSYEVEHGRSEHEWPTRCASACRARSAARWFPTCRSGAFSAAGSTPRRSWQRWPRPPAGTTYAIGMTADDLAHEPTPDDLPYARQDAGTRAQSRCGTTSSSAWFAKPPPPIATRSPGANPVDSSPVSIAVPAAL